MSGEVVATCAQPSFGSHKDTNGASNVRRFSKKPPTPKDSLTVPEVAVELGVCRRYAYRLVEQGVLPSYKVGYRRFVRRRHVTEALQRYADAAS